MYSSHIPVPPDFRHFEDPDSNLQPFFQRLLIAQVFVMYVIEYLLWVKLLTKHSIMEYHIVNPPVTCARISDFFSADSDFSKISQLRDTGFYHVFFRP